MQSLVVLVLDTFRRDAVQMARAAGHELPTFARLEALCGVEVDGLCGSFPTVPMRTDMLTGRLAFLDRRWATPDEGDRVLTKYLWEHGVVSEIVTDNYVLYREQLGAQLDRYFSHGVLVPGAGSDPWADVDADSRRAVADLPARRVDFAAQYVANARKWSAAGGPPWLRLARAGERLCRVDSRRRRLVWIDVFSMHEPWRSVDALDGSVPVSPPYGAHSQYSDDSLRAVRSDYISRVSAVDCALAGLVDVLVARCESGDWGVALLSDHGFLFGEYGLVGKPKPEPLLPPLYELYFRVSANVQARLDFRGVWQPHEFAGLVCRCLGLDDRPFRSLEPSFGGFRLLGRHSPQVNWISLVRGGEVVWLLKGGRGGVGLRVSRAGLDPAVVWEEQGEQVRSPVVSDCIQALSRRPWGRLFVR